MPFPGSLTTIEVTATLPTGAGGDQLEGYIQFEPSTLLTDTTDALIIPPAACQAQVNGGTMEPITLVCNDNANLSPSGWTWTVTPQLGGVTIAPYSINLPHTLGASVDLSDLTPVTPQATVTPYLLAVNNLDDVESPTEARANLGLGTAATASTSAFDAAGAAAGAQTAAETYAAAQVAAETARAEAAEALRLLLAGGTLSGLLTLGAGFAAEADSTVTDGSTKEYRFRVSGASLDLDAAGEDLYVSVFTEYGFAGTQYTYMRLEAGTQLLHLVGPVVVGTGPYDTPIELTPATGNIATASLTANGLNGAEPLTIAGRLSTAGAPSTGAWTTGDAVLDSANAWHYCTAGGTPGTWT